MRAADLRCELLHLHHGLKGPLGFCGVIALWRSPIRGIRFKIAESERIGEPNKLSTADKSRAEMGISLGVKGLETSTMT
jgi:hypothetical protein